jgi:hypothetical protein
MAFKFSRSLLPSASPHLHNHSLQVHLEGATAGVWRYRSNGCGKSDGEYIFGRPRSRETSSHFHILLSYNEYTHSIFPNCSSHSLCPRYCGSMQLCGILNARQYHIFSPDPYALRTSMALSNSFRFDVARGAVVCCWRVHCLFAPSFHHTGVEMVYLKKFSQWTWPGAPPIMLEYHLWPD